MIEWRPVPGLSRYEATSCGLLRSVGRTMHTGRGGEFYREGKILTPNIHRQGRSRYCLRDDDGASTSISPQRITFMTFLGIIPDGYAVEIIDNDLPPSVDNIKLMRHGVRVKPDSEVRARKPKSTMEGYCSLIGEFLRMRYT